MSPVFPRRRCRCYLRRQTADLGSALLPQVLSTEGRAARRHLPTIRFATDLSQDTLTVLFRPISETNLSDLGFQTIVWTLLFASSERFHMRRLFLGIRFYKFLAKC